MEEEVEQVKPQDARNVPWASSSEWNFVRKNLFSEDMKKQRDAFHRLTCWRTRLGLKSPMAILCTLNLMEAKLADMETMDSFYLAHMYSLALLKSIGLILDSIQTGGIATPMHVLARQIGIPQWIIELRHEATHSGGIPSLCLVRLGTEILIGWLKKQFWDAYCPRLFKPKQRTVEYELSDFRAEDDLTALLIEFQQNQFQVIVSGENSSPSQKESIKRIKNRLGSQDASNTLISILIRDGFLVPTTEQLTALKISAALIRRKRKDKYRELNTELQKFWRPILNIVHKKGLISKLVHSLVTCLSRMKQDREDEVANLLMGWVVTIATARPLPDGSRCKNHVLGTAFSKKVVDQDWSPVYAACVAHPNSYTDTALQVLLDTVGQNLPQSTKEQLVNLTRLNDIKANDVIPPDLSLDEDMVISSDHPAAMIVRTSSDNVEANESEEVALLRGTQYSPWSLASDAVRWNKYPIGKLPGQLDHPTYLYLKCGKSLDETTYNGTLGMANVEDRWDYSEMSDADSDTEASGQMSSYFVSNIREERLPSLEVSSLLSLGNASML